MKKKRKKEKLTLKQLKALDIDFHLYLNYRSLVQNGSCLRHNLF